jgi:hypothetical protein
VFALNAALHRAAARTLSGGRKAPETTFGFLWRFLFNVQRSAPRWYVMRPALPLRSDPMGGINPFEAKQDWTACLQ